MSGEVVVLTRDLTDELVSLLGEVAAHDWADWSDGAVTPVPEWLDEVEAMLARLRPDVRYASVRPID